MISKRFWPLAAAASLLLLLTHVRAAEAPAAATTNAISAGLDDIVKQINAKLAHGDNEESDLADNFKQMDALIAQHKDAPPSELAHVLEAKAELYFRVLHDPEKSVQILKQMQHDYPGTEMATNAAAAMPQLEAMVEKQIASRTNVIGGLNSVIAQINAKIKSGKDKEEDFTDNFKSFDVLIAAHKEEDPANLAVVLVRKLELYAQVFEDYDQAEKVAEQIIHDYPGTPSAEAMAKDLDTLKMQAEKSKLQKTLVEGAKFPPFSEKDLDGKLLATTNYPGKVVLVDFWATWCGPCRGEVPNVVKAYQQYHDKGFEIIGVSLDKADGKGDLLTYTKDNQMTWPEYFDGGYWTNKLATQYAIMAIPANYLLDSHGVIIAKNVRGDALGEAVAKALAVK